MNAKIHRLTMPKWGLSMQEGKVVDWLLEVGTRVEPGDRVVEVESEKIANAVEAVASGILRRQLAQPGESVPVAGLLAVIAEASVPDAEIDDFVAEFQAQFVPSSAEEESADIVPVTVDVEGRRVRYVQRGEGGDPAILIHGFGGDVNNWLFNHEALAIERSVYALDLPGHGSSAKDVAKGTAEDFARVLSGLMTVLGISTAHLVGHSLGGTVAMEFARAFPARALSLTLIASAGLGQEIDGEYIEGFTSASRRKDLKPLLQKLFADPSLASRQLVDDVLKYKRLDGIAEALRTVADALCLGGAQRVVLRDTLPGLSIPVLVLWGKEDRIIPVAHAQGLPENIETRILEGGGHMVQMEQASEVNRLIRGFWGRRSG
jgi:pyruvate dehydrogenase E2 component (dihydrolipoamide acetyltransferase)